MQLQGAFRRDCPRGLRTHWLRYLWRARDLPRPVLRALPDWGTEEPVFFFLVPGDQVQRGTQRIGIWIWGLGGDFGGGATFSARSPGIFVRRPGRSPAAHAARGGSLFPTRRGPKEVVEWIGGSGVARGSTRGKQQDGAALFLIGRTNSHGINDVGHGRAPDFGAPHGPTTDGFARYGPQRPRSSASSGRWTVLECECLSSSV